MELQSPSLEQNYIMELRMKKIVLLLLCTYIALFADKKIQSYHDYLNSFTYEERKEMKINKSSSLLESSYLFSRSVFTSNIIFYT